MLVNIHSYYSLRYGTLSVEKLLDHLIENGYTTAVLTDINNSSGMFEFVQECRQRGITGLVGMEFRNGDQLLYIGIAKNADGFRELNELITSANLTKTKLPEIGPAFRHCFILYPFGSEPLILREHEYIGIKRSQVNRLFGKDARTLSKCVMYQPFTFCEKKDFLLHCQLRAVNHNILLSQLQSDQAASRDEYFISKHDLYHAFASYPILIRNSEKLVSECSFDFDFKTQKNKRIFTTSIYEDKLLLENLAYEGVAYRYGGNNTEALRRVRDELEIIQKLGFCSYFLITHDIVRETMSRGYYHVGRGSGANSIVAYCLKITDVCPIELDLYFARFLNEKRKSPPDFDIDFDSKIRDEVFDYIFKKYGSAYVALMGAMSTFKDRSIIREFGKVYGLPKTDIDRLIRSPEDPQNRNHITAKILYAYGQIENFPNQRTVHASGVLISDLPITSYVALDLPPKGFPTVQFDMYTAEDIGFEKFDILSQCGIGHIQDCAEIVKENKGIAIDVHDVQNLKQDKNIQAQLRSGDTIGCFYVESPAMRQLLKKLKCSEYLTLVAASSIIRPGVAKSGMMRAYIERYHKPETVEYLHPIMEQQLKETFGVMVYQEDVLKVAIHFGGLDAADGDVLRRMMSGKRRDMKLFNELSKKYFDNCKRFGYPDAIALEVWRQIESFAGYSFSKAHSASFAVESFQSLFLKTYYPLEFMVAVINNFGGFYSTRVYINEAKKSGGKIHLPCVNESKYLTAIKGTDIHLGFVHIKGLETTFAKRIFEERVLRGTYASMEDLVNRTSLTLEQLLILIRIGALRFTGKDKKRLLWEAHALLQKSKRASMSTLFVSTVKEYSLPKFETLKLEDAYDEIELLGWPESLTVFDMLKTSFRGEINAANLIEHLGQNIRMVGEFVASKHVPTARGEMAFGAFVDTDGNFFDTTNFPQSYKAYPFRGAGGYLIKGKVVQEFGFPSIEVEKMARLPIQSDPRSA